MDENLKFEEYKNIGVMRNIGNDILISSLLLSLSSYNFEKNTVNTKTFFDSPNGNSYILSSSEFYSPTLVRLELEKNTLYFSRNLELKNEVDDIISRDYFRNQTIDENKGYYGYVLIPTDENAKKLKISIRLNNIEFKEELFIPNIK